MRSQAELGNELGLRTQVSQCFFERHDVGKPSLDVVQGEDVASRRAVADALADDHGPKTITLGVGCRGADAGAGAAAGDEQRVRSVLNQIACQMGAKERAGVFLSMTRSCGCGATRSSIWQARSSHARNRGDTSAADLKGWSPLSGRYGEVV